MDISEIKVLSPGTAVHGKGQKKVKEILEVATNLLAYEGYSRFTMRRIADELGVALRNVQYYFKTKESLFQAVVEQRLIRDLDSARETIQKAGEDAEVRFMAFVDLSLQENSSRYIRGLQFELWALANHDEFAAKCRDHMTSEYSKFIYELIVPLTEGQSEQTRREKSVILLSMLQGFPLIDGSDIHIEFELDDLRQVFRAEALRFIKETSD